MWSQTTIRPPGFETRAISARVARTAAGVGDVVQGGDGEDEVEAGVLERQLVPRAPHGGHLGMLGSHHVEHALGGIEPGHLEAAGDEAGGQDPGPAADVEADAPPLAGAVRGDEVDPLAQVVLDDVRRQRLVVLAGDPVEGLLAHCGSSRESASIANRSGRTIRRGVRIRNLRIISIIRRPIRIAAAGEPVAEEVPTRGR